MTWFNSDEKLMDEIVDLKIQIGRLETQNESLAGQNEYLKGLIGDFLHEEKETAVAEQNRTINKKPESAGIVLTKNKLGGFKSLRDRKLAYEAKTNTKGAKINSIAKQLLSD